MKQEEQLNNVEALKAELEKARAESLNAQKELAESRTKSKAVEAKFNALKDNLENLKAKIPLPKEIEELKNIDPDKWYEEKRKYEASMESEIVNKLAEVEKLALESATKSTHSELWEEFRLKHPEITEDYINNDIPLRLKRKLDNKEVSFGEFLAEVADYHGKGSVVGKSGAKTLDQPDLSKMGSAGGVVNSTAEARARAQEFKSQVI